MQVKPQYRMKLLSSEEDQESAETNIVMVVEQKTEQIYLDIQSGLHKLK